MGNVNNQPTLSDHILIHDGQGNVTLQNLTIDGSTVNYIPGTFPLTTDDINEGITNLYYTDARVDVNFATKTTTDLAEGSNLYFTDQRVSDYITNNTTLVSQQYVDDADAQTLILANSYTDSQVAAEANDRASSISTLQSNIDNEETARIAADGVLQSNIDNEETARIAADVTITAAFTNADASLESTLQAYADQAQLLATTDANAYTDASILATTSVLQAYADQAEADANLYTDNEVAFAITQLQTYADTAEADAVTAAESYTDAREAAITIAYETYADIAEVDAVTAANAYTDTREAAITIAYETYADTAEADAVTAANAYTDTEIAALSTVYVNVNGDTMSGTLNMGSNPITNVSNPSSAQDVATKSYVDSAVSSGTGVLTSDDIVEGTTNLYFTDARVDSIVDPQFLSASQDRAAIRNEFAAADTTLQNNIDAEETSRINADILLQTNIDNEESARISADSAITTQISLLSTSDITEGTNLYFTTARAEDAFDDHLLTKTTDDLSEGSNLYYTDARANSAIDTRVTKSFVDALGIQASTVAANSVVLGTDTTGNYIATISGTTGEISVTGSGSESAAVTIGLPADVTIQNDLTVEGNLTVNGTTTTVDVTNLSVTDNLIYLNNGGTATITNAVGNGSSVTYTADNNFNTGYTVDVTGITPSAYNVTGATITSANATSFTISSTATGTYTSGGTARAHTNTNVDLGWAGSYNDGTYAHAGIFRDATDGKFKVFDGYVPEPDDAVDIDTSHASFSLADIQADNFIGSLTGNVTGNASTATKLATARTIAISGDVITAAPVAFDGSANIVLSTTIQPNSVALGTDTTGAYVMNALTSGKGISGSATGETSQFVVTSSATEFNVADSIVYRDANGEFYASKVIADVQGNLIGTLQGNADTASALQTARTITVNGAVSGSTNFDGSANVTITTVATSDPTLTLAGDVTGSATFTNLGNATLTATIAPNSVALGTDTTGAYVANASVSGNGLTGNATGESSTFTVTSNATPVNTASTIVFRNANGEFYASKMYGDVQGNLAGQSTTATKLTTPRVITLGGDLTGSATFDGSADITISAIVDDDSHNHVISNIDGLIDYTNDIDAATPSAVLGTLVRRHDTTGNISAASFTGPLTGNVTGNASTATKLATARTISLTGDATGSATFDGSANASITVIIADDSHNHVISNIDGLSAYTTIIDAATPSAVLGTLVKRDATTGNISADKFTGPLTGNVTGNASTATKLLTARNIALSGDVTGSINFDGSANVSIVATVADDSHNHIIANVDGLQDALDLKLNSADYTAADVLAKLLTVDGAGSGLDADTVDGLTSAAFLRANATDTATGIITFSNTTASTSTTTGAVKVTGGVGIGGALFVGAGITASGDVTAFSDERLKDNIIEITDAVNKVEQLRGITYVRKADGIASTGVIAQEVEKVLPQAISVNEDGMMSVKYGNMIGLLIEAIKEQQKQINELQNEVANLKK